MTVELELTILLKWKDLRLSLKHLIQKKTFLSEEDRSRIWIPHYQMSDLDGGHIQLVDTNIYINTSYGVTQPDVNDLLMDKTYPGSSNDIVLQDEHAGTFACLFELHAYPFDTQTCQVSVTLSDRYREKVSFSFEKSIILYTGTAQLASYTIKNAKLGSMSNSHTIQLTFELERRSSVTLLSTFVPSVLLLCIGWATLFVRLEALNVRAVMSLTTLLVLYTLFSNVSSSLPDTA